MPAIRMGMYSNFGNEVEREKLNVSTRYAMSIDWIIGAKSVTTASPRGSDVEIFQSITADSNA